MSVQIPPLTVRPTAYYHDPFARAKREPARSVSAVARNLKHRAKQ